MSNSASKSLVMSLLFAVWATLGTHAQSADHADHLKAVSVEELKAMYLVCDRLASTTFLDFQTATECSMISEEVLTRGFAGNFSQLLEWWRSTRNDCTKDSSCQTQ